MEALLAQDFEPWHTNLFSFGLDEEVGGYRGAAAENGFMDIVLTIETSDEHMIRLPKYAAGWIMSELIVALEGHAFTPKLDIRTPCQSGPQICG